jgi:hypothetical protein
MNGSSYSISVLCLLVRSEKPEIYLMIIVHRVMPEKDLQNVVTVRVLLLYCPAWGGQ